VTQSGQSGSGGDFRSDQVAKEVLELQDELTSTKREINEVSQYLARAQREQKMSALTVGDLENVGDDVKMFQGVGKMFMRATHDEIIKNVTAASKGEEKKEVELQKKLDYLQKKFKSQTENYWELRGVSQPVAAA
jgi:chaperonin cofactor prefoldin|tara:strand:+ start:512 stop:916 length:405 start_codon:yes stop_codon:yes gene_type:complete